MNIVDYAHKEPNGLIAMSARGQSGIARWLLGSVTDKVLHNAKSPLLVVRSEGDALATEDVKVGNLIVPLDGSPVAEQVIPHVASLATELPATVTLVEVTRSPREFRGLVDNVASSYLAETAEALRQQGPTSVDERIIHGDAANGILELSEDIPDALIAMATHGRSGLGRWLIGSVVDRVVHHATTPVLIVRATGQTEGQPR